VAVARVDVLADGVDRAALAGGVAAFDDHHDAAAALLGPARHRHQFAVEGLQPIVIFSALHGHLACVDRVSLAVRRQSANARRRGCLQWFAGTGPHALLSRRQPL